MRNSFYILRSSLIHSANPLTKLVMVFCLLIISYAANFYWTPTLLILGVLLPLGYYSKIPREYLGTLLRLLVPLAGVLFLMQSLFIPTNGEAVFKFYFLDATMESIRLGYQSATRLLVMAASFLLLLMTTHPSELMGDLTRRGVPGQIAYVVVTTLQLLPRMQVKAVSIMAAQQSRGMNAEGGLFKRIAALIPLIRPLVFGSLAEVEERAIAIEARAFMSDRPKTFLREIPDTRIDKAIRYLLLAAAFAVIMVN